jgi:hypothetical protein
MIVVRLNDMNATPPIKTPRMIFNRSFFKVKTNGKMTKRINVASNTLNTCN